MASAIWDKINPETTNQYQQELNQQFSPATRKRRLSSLRRFFRWAVDEGHLKENPLKNPQAPQPQVSREELRPRRSLFSSFFQLAKIGIGVIIIVILVLLLSRRYLPDLLLQLPTKPSEVTTQVVATYSPWIINFRGKLTDSQGGTITGQAQAVFRIYNQAEEGELIWESKTWQLEASPEGEFQAPLGDTTRGDKELPSRAFFQNERLYLGITLEGQTELTPRIPVSTAAHVADALLLNEFSPSQAPEGNMVPVLTPEGHFILAAPSPKINSTSGTFAIEGQAITLLTPTSSDGNITLAPDGAGVLNVRLSGTSGNQMRVTDSNLTSGNLVSIYSGNDLTGFDLLSLSSGSTETEKFTVSARGDVYLAGNLGIGTSSPTQKLEVDGGAYISGEIKNLYGKALKQGHESTITANGWYRIAQTSSRASGLFNIMDMTTDRHQSVYFYASVAYPDSDNQRQLSLNLLSNVRHDQNTFFKARFVRKTDSDPVYLEIYVENANNNQVKYILSQNDWDSGWSPIDWQTGEIPSGYTTIEYAIGSLEFAVGGNSLTLSQEGTLTLGGNLLSNSDSSYDLGSSTQKWDKLYVNQIIGGGTGTVGYWQRNSQALSPTNITDDVLIGATATASALVKFPGVSGGDTWFNAGGNVGVGTTSPSSTLTVAGTFNITENTTLGDASGDTLTINAAALSLANASTLDLASSTTALNIESGLLNLDTSNSRVGIGTTDPSYKLDVNGDIQIVNGSELYSYGSATLGNRTYTEDNYVTDDETFTSSIDALDQALADVGTGASGLWLDGDPNDYIYPNSTYSSNVYLDSGYLGVGYDPSTISGGVAAFNGNVGIGITGPSEKLHVSESKIAISDASTSDGASPGIVWDTQSSTDFSFDGKYINVYGFGFYTSTGGGGNAAYASGWYGVELFTGGASRLLVDENGNVGIGTTDPADKLEVAGAIRFGSGSFVSGQARAYTASDNGLIISGEAGSTYDFLLAESGGQQLIANPAGTNNVILSPTGTGNVGIGTTDPSEKLEVYGDEPKIRITDDGGDYTELRQYDSGEFAINQYGTGGDDFGIQNDGDMYLGMYGNVGIGTTDPGSLLHVYGGASNSLLKLQTTSTGDVNAAIQFIGGSTNANWQIGTQRADIFGAANNLGFYQVGGTGTVMVLQQGGNVGIGTTTPFTRSGFGSPWLTISSTAPGINLVDSDLANRTRFISASGGQLQTGLSNDDGSSPSVHLTITYDGNVGIGTTTPTRPLHVLPGSSGSSILIGRVGSGSGNGQSWGLGIHNSAASDTVYLGQSSSAYTTGGSIGWIGNSMAFLYYPSELRIGKGTGSTPAITLDSSLNVGIGTTGPGVQLHVAMDAGSVPSFGSATGFAISNSSATSDDAAMAIISGTAASSMLGFGDSGDENMGQIWYDNNVNEMFFRTNNGGADMTIDINGNVGIGTTNPSQELEVAGDVVVTTGVAGGTSSLFLGTADTTKGILYLYGDNDYDDGLLRIYHAALQDTTADYWQFEPRYDGTLNIGDNNDPELITIKSSGNVGIGNTDPSEELEVNGDIAADKLVDTADPNYYVDPASSGTGLYVGHDIAIGMTSSSDDDYIYFDTGASTYLAWINGNTAFSFMGGNLGIGTTSPGGILELYGTTDPLLRFNRDGSLYTDAYVNSSGDLVWDINNGRAFKIEDDTTELFSVSEASVSAEIPAAFNAAGDVEIAYNLNFSHDTASYIRSLSPLYIEAGDPNSSEDLTLRSRGTGDVVVDDDLNIDASQTQTTNGLCHSGADSDTTFTDRYVVACSAAPGDVAEWYDTKDAEPGDIVTTTGETITYNSPAVDAKTGVILNQEEALTASILEKANQPYQPNLLGIISTSPYESFGKSIIEASQNPNPVALTGRTPVKVSTINGPIAPGDPITSSSLPGVGMKATGTGLIVGRALDYYDDPNPEAVGKILVFVNLSWYDPDIYLTNNGEVQILAETYQGLLEPTEENKETILSLDYLAEAAGKMVKRLGRFSKIATSKIKTGLLETTNLVADTLLATKAGFDTVISQQIKTDLISPLSEQGDITLQLGSPEATGSGFGQLLVQNQAGETVASIDEAGNATFSGTLYADKVVAEEIVGLEGKFGDLLASTVSAQKIETLENRLAQLEEEPEATESSQPEDDLAFSEFDIETLVNEILNTAIEATPQADLADMDVHDFSIADNLTVLGSTSLAETSVAGSLSVDGTMVLADSSINTLTGPLYLQNLGLGGIDILAGKIVIDQEGNLTVEGDVTVKGSLFANMIQPLDEQDLIINLSHSEEATGSGFGQLLVKGIDGEVVASIDASGSAQFASLDIEADYSATESGAIIAAYDNYLEMGVYAPAIETNATAGIGILPAYETEVIIKSPFVTDKSLIYLTPISDTANQVLYLEAKKAHQTAVLDEFGLEVEPEEKGWFKVALDDHLNQDIKFNWWIIN